MIVSFAVVASRRSQTLMLLAVRRVYLDAVNFYGARRH